MIYIPGKPNVHEPKDEFIRLVRGDFNIDLSKRISLVADVNHFKFREDSFVWDQARGRIPNYYEVYFDGVWICDFMDNEQLPSVRLKFLKGFLDKYQKGEVFLTLPEERVEQIVESAVDKAIRKNKNKKIESQEDYVVQQVTDGLLQEKKKKTQPVKLVSSI